MDGQRSQNAALSGSQGHVPKLLGYAGIRRTPLSQRLKDRNMDKPVFSENAPEPMGAYAHARRVGNLLFLSGVGPRKRNSTQIPGVTLDAAGQIIEYDIEAQCHSV